MYRAYGLSSHSALQPLSYHPTQVDHTFGFLNKEDNYTTVVIRSKLTRNIAATFDKVSDEIVKALGEYIPATTSEGM